MANIKCQFGIAFKREVVRYNGNEKISGKVTFKTLTDSLKALEEDGLVSRKEYLKCPSKVEYSLTEKEDLRYLCFWLCVHVEKNIGIKIYCSSHKHTSRSTKYFA